MSDDIKYWIWLSSLVKITPRKRYELIGHFGSPALLWHAQEKELQELSFLDKGMIGHIMDKQKRKEARHHYEKLVSLDIDIVTLESSLYPKALKDIYDPPVALYIKGKLVKEEQAIAVVGSRRATPYGLETAERLAAGLSGYGLTIVSGMARGIDSKAHKGALQAGGRTIAVLGCGLDIVYPSENKELMKNICTNGAVISEYLPGIPPIAFNFPARNRIISGMSLGVAVIEANEKSGSLITANFALEQGREVFAIPGNINSSNSTGTNKLIRDGAKIILDLADILDELKMPHGDNNNFYMGGSGTSTAGLDAEEKKIIKRLEKGPWHIDALAAECNLSVNGTGAALVMLELKGMVEQLPGKIYKLAK